MLSQIVILCLNRADCMVLSESILPGWQLWDANVAAVTNIYHDVAMD